MYFITKHIPVLQNSYAVNQLYNSYTTACLTDICFPGCNAAQADEGEKSLSEMLDQLSPTTKMWQNQPKIKKNHLEQSLLQNPELFLCPYKSLKKQLCSKPVALFTDQRLTSVCCWHPHFMDTGHPETVDKWADKLTLMASVSHDKICITTHCNLCMLQKVLDIVFFTKVGVQQHRQ